MRAIPVSERVNAFLWSVLSDRGVPPMANIRTDVVSNLLEPLTDRELEVLALLVQRMTNQEIAERLTIALPTVKWYNTQIFGKLGVQSRREAVERARSLGLLSAPTDPQEFTPRNNLPLQPTRFVGRLNDLTSIASLFADPGTRLVTILAPGGMGKTRLALAAAERQVRQFRDGVFFVPLVTLGSRDEIITAIADHVGFNFYGPATPREQLLEFLRERHLLLVLDNFEHLLEGALLISDILQFASAVRILTTSRERLNLRSETVYELRGLAFPAEQTFERIRGSDAVELFILSAQRVHPGFVPQENDLTHVAEICRLTAGMPLAIELAAGWFDTLSLEHIAREIDQGIDILATNLRDLPERHRSVRATFESTWTRLTDDERMVFRGLSVFRGSFTVLAADAVVGANAHHLRGLAQKVLIQSEGNGRFTIHELLRQFGADKLAETDEDASVRAKHAAFFADFMQARQRSIFAPEQLEVLDQIEADYENIRAAWNWLVDQRSFDELPKFLNCLRFFFHVRNRWQESVELFEMAVTAWQSIPQSDESELALGRLWARLAWFYSYIGSWEKGRETAEAAVRLLQQHDSPEDLIVAYRNLALISMLLKDGESQRQMAEAAYTLAHKIGSKGHQAYCLIQLNFAAISLNDDIAVARSAVRQARTIFEELGDQWGLMTTCVSDAGIAFQVEDFELSRLRLTQGLALARAFGATYYVASIILYLGVVTLRKEEYGLAWGLLVQSLRAFWEAGHTHFAHAPLQRMAQLLLQAGKDESAVEILALTDRYRGYHGHGVIFEFSADEVEGLRKELESRLGADRFTVVWAQGRGRDLHTVVADLLLEDVEA